MGKALAAAGAWILHVSIAAASTSCLQSLTSPVEIALPPDGGEVGVPIPSASWVTVEEMGRAVDIAVDAGTPRIEVNLPPRYGLTFLETATATVLRVRGIEPGRESPKIRVTTRCVEDPTWAATRTWWEAIASLAHETDKSLSSVEADALAIRVSNLSTHAPDVRGRALASHIVAQIELQSQQFGLAATGFATAEQKWLDVPDPARAAAARVGRAESLVASGRYDAALDLVPLPDKESQRTYYEVRLVNSRCISLHYLHQLKRAEVCYRWLARQLGRLDERIEHANALRNYADLQLALGDPDQAMESAQKAFRLAAGPNAPMVKGRAMLTAADISIARGDLHAAVADADIALANFVEAAAPSWQGDALLKAAVIFTELGARDEAYLSVREAFTRYSSDEPALVAAALAVYARIEHDNQRYAESVFGYEAAARIYANLKMPEELERTRLALWRGELDAGDVSSTAHALAQAAPVSSTNTVARNLLEAEIALRRKDYAHAHASLDALRLRSIGFSQAITAARLEANMWRAQGHASRADAVLDNAVHGIDAIARSTTNSLLRMLLARQSRALRADAADALLARANAIGVGADGADLAWRWLTAGSSDTGAFGGADTASRSRTASRLDRAIAAELLPVRPSTEDSDISFVARRELLSLLAGDTKAVDTHSRAQDGPLLREAQLALDRNEGLLAYIRGNNRGAMLYVTRDRAALYPFDAGRSEQAYVAADRLRRLVATPSVPWSRISTAAAEMSEILFATMPVMPTPSHLYVVTQDVLDGLPWELLTWPGATGTLLDTTSVRQTRIVTGAGHASDTQSAIALHIVVPARLQRAHSELPELGVAGVEPAIIRNAIRDSRIVADANADTTPAGVLSAFGQSHGWIHVAAHGSALPTRIGYAGIWLDPPLPEVKPAFLSWLDILDQGVRADLVVLNACQLGDSGDAINGNLSFASAVSQAGAKQVVASLWPVSDAASAIWVPAFYSALTADPKHDAAEALRSAQLKLRSTRAFRHPFYWAGMQTFTRLSVPVMSVTKKSSKTAEVHVH